MIINKTVLQKSGFTSCSASGWRLWHRDIPDDGFLSLCCNDLKTQSDAFESVSCGADSDDYRFNYNGRTFYFKEFLNRGGKKIIKNLFRGTRSMRALAGELVLRESGLNSPLRLCATLLHSSAKRLNTSPNELYISLTQAMAEHGESLRRQRQRAYLNQSQRVSKTETSAGTWRLCHGFDLNVAESAVRMHSDLVKNDVPILVKNDKKRRLSRVKVNGISYIVKEYINPGPWGRFSAGCLSWTAATGLETYGIRACRHHAWLKASSGQSYIIIEDLGIKNLHHQLINAKNSVKRRRLLGLAGKLLGYLHCLKIYHRDMKDDNFIIDDQQAFAKILKDAK